PQGNQNRFPESCVTIRPKSYRRLVMRLLPLVLLLGFGLPASAQQPGGGEIRAAVGKPIALLQKVGISWYEKQTCTSCHQQDLPMMVFRMARERGIALD